ncbi:alpha/beta hydrolase [Epibacterium sp. SM1979]|uniref:Alpha/beta hydrolase n=1 Tax=Tritonibacter litoralis TaxID=2662264 RepID=A0A843YFI0_9RHOB|nr:alpha/beta hydrolase [Tritonibacter litoralis]MQQ07849.1 alpha/beta hydrolase [Tritonibacter litoralis]
MAVLRINAVGADPRLHGSPAKTETVLEQVAQDSGPVILMVHGYKYQPYHSKHCPHRHLFSLDPDHMPWKAPSWPRQLGFGLGHDDEGLAIAFGWDARGSLVQAQNSAVAAGRAMAKVIGHLHQANPARPIHIIGHSLGADIAFEALHHLPANAVSRIVSLTGATYQSRALAALDTAAGRTVELFNVTSRENDPYDYLFELLTTAPVRGDRAIGQGLMARNAVTMQIDCLKTLGHLATRGSVIARPQRRVCHWSSYTRSGTLRFYKRLMRKPETFPLVCLRNDLPAQNDSRWSRIFAPRPRPAPLPVWQQL